MSVSSDTRFSTTLFEPSILNPNLAIAYARKGSIYYRLGDISRATVNWNIALTLDPEYDEVQTVLMNLKDDKDLKSSVILPE